jgi:sodium transport system ATP-binding protein
MIEAVGLAKSFGTVHAVREVSFRAEDRAVTGLLGPNGAGKSTTLRMLYGMLRPDQGTIRVDGIDVVADPQAGRSMLGVLPDARGLYPRLTAREHIHYFAALRGMPKAIAQQRAEVLLDRLDMRAIADRQVQGFSQGERVKVALARAIVHDPGTVLLDEPTNGLDVMSVRAVRDMVRALRERGCCVVLSSHVMQEIAALCDRVVIVAGGSVVADGTLDELRTQTGFDDLEDAFVSLTERKP